MSTSKAHPLSPRTRPKTRRLAIPAPLLDALARNQLLVVLVTVLATVLVFVGPALFVGDSWSTLVAGREIVGHGLPRHEALTVMAAGRRWTDQQWLGQLIFYGADRLGGLRLAVLLHAALVTAAFGAAVAAARAHGASARSTLIVAAAGLVVAPWSWQLRAQALALPLFVVTLALLAADRFLTRRRTLLVFPALVLWANVHGSVVLGAALVSWAGILGLGELAARRESNATVTRSLFLLLAPWACVLASPYGFDLVDYYRLLLADSPVSEVIVEWQPPSPEGYLLVFFAVAAATALLAIWQRRRLDLYRLGVLALTLAGALRSARGIVWFALAAVVLVPVALDGVLGPGRAPVHRRVGLTACAVSAGALVAVVGVFAPRGDDWWAKYWPAEAATVVAHEAAAIAGPKAVYPSDKHSDWLLWAVPELRGRVAYDIRFELLTREELRSLVRYKSLEPGWEQAAEGYPIVVVDPHDTPKQTMALAERGARVLFRDDTIVVIVHETPE